MDCFDMDAFRSEVKNLAKLVIQRKDKVSTEEATKMSLVCPFFQALGYDVYDPDLFVPEFTADVGMKKGEKVDYAVMCGGKPAIIIEAKAVGTNLDNHMSQLYRYFNTVDARIAVLTNGVEYRFYTDMDDLNKMDGAPFLTVDMSNLDDMAIDMLSMFHRMRFDEKSALDMAFRLKYRGLFLDALAKHAGSPSNAFVSVMLDGLVNERKTPAVLDRFRPVLQQALREFGGMDAGDVPAVVITAGKKPCMTCASGKRSRFRFDELGIPVGAELVSTLDDTVRPVVLDGANHVKYNGLETTLSAITAELKGGGSWQGTVFFTYEGELLDIRRKRLAKEQSSGNEEV